MWVMTPRGFYSVVQKREDRRDDKLVVRTRNREDVDALSDLIPGAKPYRVKGSDYSWRIKVTREQWQSALTMMASEITYPNFKDEVKRKQGQHRANVYLRVWSTLLGLSDRRRRPAPRRAREFDWSAPLFVDDVLDGGEGK